MRISRNGDRKGTSAILVILLFGVLMVICAFVLNVSLIQRHHASAQIASDLASRYGVDELSRLDQADEEDLNDIREKVMTQAKDNWQLSSSKSSQDDLENMEVEVEFGKSMVDQGVPVFYANETPVNSVRVRVKKEIDLWTLNDEQKLTTSVYRDATAAALERDLCLVIDRSGSMNFDLDTGNWMYDYGQHPYNALSNSSQYKRISYAWWWYWPHPTKSRWSTMVPALYGLIEELEKTNQKELFSIVSYSNAATINFYDHQPQSKTYTVNSSDVEANPTFDYLEAVEEFDYKYRYTQPVAGGTNISSGIDMARTVLTGGSSRPFAFKTMIVMTDGQNNAGRAPWIAAADAAAAGVQVYTVTFSHQADQDSMKRTAENGKGRHFHAPDGDALEEVFREIAKMPAAAIIE